MSAGSADASRIESVVREALKSVRPNAGNLDGNTDLTGELGMDSVEVMDMVMEIEDELDISVPVEVLSEARTLNELCAGICKLIG